MRIGVHLPHIGRKAGPEAIRRAAIQAEELGFADAWSSEHIIVPKGAPYPPSAIFYDPVLTLTWAAAYTKRIGLGTSVLVLPMRHPLPLAKELATLQNLSEGRLILGAGVGWLAAEFEALGAPFRERGRRMDEGIAMMRAVWSEDPVSFEARHIPAVIEEMRILPQPVKPIPVWIGGSSEAALSRAIRLGDGWHGSRLTPEQAAPIARPIAGAAPGARIRAVITLRLGRQGRKGARRPHRRLWRGRHRPCPGRARRTAPRRLAAYGRARRPRDRAIARLTAGGNGAMKLGMTLRVSPTSGIDMEAVWEAERLGFEAVWCGEAYGTDAVSPVAWVLARTKRIKAGTSIMQMPARTPACAAMTAMTLQALSGNRFLCGVGPSGPQVVEGWHGVAFGKPLARTREYIAIIRQILERKAPLEFHGEHYQIPYAGPGSTGLGKPLRSIIHGDPSLKFYTAAVAPNGLRTAGEVADGTLPFFMSPEKAEAIVAPIREGIAKAGDGKTSPISTPPPMSGSRSATISPTAAT